MVLAVVQLIDSTGWALVCKPRPDFIATCKPDLNKIEWYHVKSSGMDEDLDIIKIDSPIQELNAPYFVRPSICRSVPKVFDQNWAAFPSGHVAFAVSCSTYLALWLTKRHNLGSRILSYSLATEPVSTTKGNGIEKFGRGIVLALFTSTPGRPSIAGMIQVLVGYGLSLYVAISRYEDHKHSFMDILCSAAFGAFVGWFGFWLYHSSEYPVTAKEEEATTQPSAEMQHDQHGHTLV